ncbi:MAG: DUF402 domain-containing protein [Acidimicrobiia bacterium]|nr:DUF402 domain-containing protein [Acidimicrobiia bacterium]
MGLIHVDLRKWPDRRHWQLRAAQLGEDSHGVWLHAPGRTVAQRGHEPPRPLEAGFVGLIPRSEWWIVEFYWDHPRHEVYLNVGTPPQWDGDRMTQIDLDLDVVRYLDGSVEVLDGDEFSHHQVKYEYLDDVVSAALSATERAVELLKSRAEPFGSIAIAWMERAGHT